MTLLISSAVGILHISSFTSEDITGGMRLQRSGGQGIPSSVKRELNLSLTWWPISFLSKIHPPESFVIASIELCLLRIMVERWKNFVFWSSSRNQISRDFCFQTISLQLSHSFNSLYSFASFFALMTETSWPWISLISLVSSFMRVWQKPNTFLFHFFIVLMVAFCFLQSFTLGQLVNAFIQDLRTTSVQRGSLTQAASNQKGLGEKESLGLESKSRGEWSELIAPRW